MVIPNLNGKELLHKNLPSVVAALRSSDAEHEIIVADDASQDDSISFLEENYPSILVIKNPKTQGFSKNINSGLRRASKRLVLALNSDVTIAIDYFTSQLQFFEKPDTFGVMGSLWNPDTHKISDGAKVCEQTFFGIIRSTRNIIARDDKPLFSFFLSGANALMDREKLDILGYFNELFSPFYNEDVELSLRAWRMGWKCYFQPRAKAYHLSSNTIKKTSSKRQIRAVSLKNRWILHDLHLDYPKRSFFFASLFVNTLFRWLLGDRAFYQALKIFRSQKSQVNENRRGLDKLNLSLSTAQVITFLKKSEPKENVVRF